MEINSTISTLDVGDIKFEEPLSNHSSWHIGGLADIFVEPHTMDHIRNIIQYSNKNEIPLIVIGNGSNILFNDGGIRGIVVKLGEKFSHFTINGTRVIAESGIYVPDLAQAVANAGLSGLEHTIGIPGTLGGLVFMNGGSQKKSIGECINRVWVIDKSAEIHEINVNECNFSYRHSSLQTSATIICKVELSCKRGERVEIEREMTKILAARKQKFPLDLPSCGSVFISNPVTSSTIGPPGKLIEEAGLKGYKIGGAQVSDCHANFIVNTGNATACDVIRLIHHIRQKIFEQNGIWLECEIRYITEFGKILPLHGVGLNE